MKKIKYYISALAVLVAPILVIQQAQASSISLKIRTDSANPSKTATEISGTPALSKTVKLRAQYPHAPLDDVTVKVTVDSQCTVGLYSGGFTSKGTSVSKSVPANTASYVDFYVWGVNDTKYEGDHSCHAEVISLSDDLEYNEITSSTDVNIQDNDPAPSTDKPAEKKTDADAPDVPALTKVTVGGDEVDKDGGDIEFGQDQSLVISGDTVEEGEVKLYIFSDPQTATVTANEAGDWTYTIKDLSPGDHHVEMEVTDPKTGKTSERETVLAFTVTEDGTQSDTAAADTTDKPGSGLPIWMIVLGVGVLLAIVGGGFWFWKKKKAQKTQTPPSVRQPNPAFTADAPQEDQKDKPPTDL